MSERVNVFLFLFLLMVFLLPASSEGHDSHHFDWGRFIGSILNSTILFGALIFFLRKPLIKLLTQKSIDIKTDIIERETKVALSEEQFEKIKQRLDQVQDEVKDMQRLARSKGEEEKSKIEKLGAQESQRILQITETEIKNRVESSMKDLKARIAQMTIEHFKKDIASQMDEAKHRQMIDRNIEKVAGIAKREEKSEPGEA
ncbi:MAG: hypothetical protein KAS65_07940 [Candidatus Aminicenantes bacterium]|nr:hypothetical protein [Candidatus Aminicenantes bacterium]